MKNLKVKYKKVVDSFSIPNEIYNYDSLYIKQYSVLINTASKLLL